MKTVLLLFIFVSVSFYTKANQKPDSTDGTVKTKIELTTTSVEGMKKLTANNISIWGIYLGISEDSFNKILDIHEDITTDKRTLDSGEKVINVLDKWKETDYDLFSVVIENKKVTEITLFHGLTDELNEFNKYLVSDLLLDENSVIYTSFLGNAEVKNVKENNDKTSKIEIRYDSRGFTILIRKDFHYNSVTAKLVPYNDISFILKFEK